jgi:hypothetical protein
MQPLLLRLPALALLFLLAGQHASAQSTATPSSTDLQRQLGRLSMFQQDEVLWLARCVYSESDRAHEQRLVAWVVRNRVETQYRGESYREVVLEPRQFSAFNAPSLRRNHILSLDAYSVSTSWRQALAIALDVYLAPEAERPFSVTTRHFYSPISMEGGRTPHWALDATPLSAARLGIDPYRFKFFADIDEGNDPPVHLASQAAPSIQATNQAASRTSKTLSRRTPSRTSLRSRLSGRRFSGRVKRPVRPHLDRRGDR